MPSVRKFNICIAMPKGDRPTDGVWWLKIGQASENERGQISLFVDALPVKQWDGRAMLFEQTDRNDRSVGRGQSGANHDRNDEIPL
jgi:hypothetical protein